MPFFFTLGAAQEESSSAAKLESIKASRSSFEQSRQERSARLDDMRQTYEAAVVNVVESVATVAVVAVFGVFAVIAVTDVMVVIVITLSWGAWMLSPTFLGESTQEMLKAQAAAASSAASDDELDDAEGPVVDAPWWADFMPEGRINLGLDLQGGIRGYEYLIKMS